MSNINRWKERFYLDGEVLKWKKSFHKRFVDSPVHGKVIPNGYIQVSYVDGGVRMYAYLHRVKRALHLGREPTEVDHIDRDRANNDLYNLREVSRTENHVNKSCGRVGRNLPKGVHLRKDRLGGKCYAAQLKHKREIIFKGNYHTIEEAESAYNEAHKKLCDSLGFGT